MIRMIPLAAAAALLATPALATCDGLQVHAPYARASTPMSPAGAAFMVFTNTGASDCHITGVRSDAAHVSEFHTHIEDANGVMRMTQLENGIVVPAGGEFALVRGGAHVMLMGLTAPLLQGNILHITTEFEDGTESTFDVPVDLERLPGQMPADHMSGHQMTDDHTAGHAHDH